MSGLRRMLMNKKGGFYIKSVDVTALKQGNETQYSYYVDIELSQELPQYSASITSLSIFFQLGPAPNWGSAELTRTIDYRNRLSQYALVYRVSVFKLNSKYTYCTLTITPKGEDTWQALPSIAVKVHGN